MAEGNIGGQILLFAVPGDNPGVEFKTDDLPGNGRQGLGQSAEADPEFEDDVVRGYSGKTDDFFRSGLMDQEVLPQLPMGRQPFTLEQGFVLLIMRHPVVSG